MLHFSRSLYYPFIEVHDETWLKTQCLYWDSISTIVPDGMPCYQSPTATYLRDAEILTPFYVAPGLREVREAGEETLEYLETEEGAALLREKSQGRARINSYKLADRLSHEVRVHHGKMSRTVARIFDAAAGKRGRGDWLRVPRGFADYYMTLLASCIARHEGFSILTHLPRPASLASRSMLGVPAEKLERRPVPARVAEGLLAHTILRTIAVGPRTSAKNLVKFREKHSASLGRFRTATRNLIKGLDGRIGAEALQAHLETINRDQVLPAVDELKGRLKDNRITCGYNNLKVSTLASASPTVLGTVLAGTVAGPFALVAGVGLSVVLSIANYRLQRREFLRSSPFSYVALAEARFGKS
ncbi:MAG: hypothetical protein HQ582_22090 [Planctomycetes bacterium]|nr:hypothetical protein [Planctomycetota bacterium]